jgi:SAM-dependent methyltransferase
MQGTAARSWRGIVSGCDPIPLPDATASAVICTEVLEHVDDPARFVAELARIGRPAARYLISVPDPTSESVMRIVAPRWYWEKPYHQHVYEHQTVNAMLQSAGLVIEARSGGGFDASLWWIFRMALGAQPHDPTPDAPLLRDWERTWSALLATPRGRQVAEALDALVPKSQIVIARKDDGAAQRPSTRGARRSRSLWKRRLRDGAIRLGGLDIRWSVRRAPRDHGR